MKNAQWRTVVGIGLIMLILWMMLWLPGRFTAVRMAAAQKHNVEPAGLAPSNLNLTAAEHAWLAAHPVIRIAGPRAFPPFQYVTDDGNIAGMASGYISILQERLGIQVEPYPGLLWPEVLQRTQNRELDLITCAARSADREQYLLFSTPYLSFPMVIVMRKEAGFLSGLEDLHNTSVAVIDGTSTYVWMQRDQIGIIPYVVGSPLQGLQAVSLGRAEAYVGNLASISYQIEHEGLANLKVAAPTPYGNYDLHFAVRSDWPELLSMINKTLASILPEEHSRIRQRWIAVRYEYGVDPAMLWRIGLIVGTMFVVIVGMILVWNWQVHRSEERFRGLLEYGADMILACKTDGTIVYQSPSFTPLLGYHPKALLNTTIQQLLHDDDLPGWQRMSAAITQSPTPQTLLHRFRHQQGHYLYVESHCINLLNNRAVRAIVVNARDLTEHITTEQALQQARDAAREAQHVAEDAQRASEAAQKASETANLAKSAFLANMSHELRTPLNAILGFSQILAHDPVIGPEQRENLEIISHSGKHLLSLINDVLNMSKIEAGRMTLREENIDLYRLLRDIEDMFRLPARQNGIELRVVCEPDVPQYLRTDAVKLRQILLNLLSNALKFTDEGGVTLRVTTLDIGNLNIEEHRSVSQSPVSRLQFHIEDTGVGIAEDDLEKLFEPFVQTAHHAEKVYEGTGLGLPISRRFARMLGGELTVHSTLGKGSNFQFHIQATLVEAGEVRQDTAAFSRVIGLQPGQPTYRILVVDDQWESRYLLFKLLSPLGFEVDEASNGQEAVEMFQRRKPHLIWMDMRMPVMDGYEATQRIRQLDAHIPIIALTASSFEEEQAYILNAGCDAFLRKPFKEFEIFDLLHQHLEVHFLYEGALISHAPSETIAVSDDALEHDLLELPEAIFHKLQYTVEGIDLEGTRESITQIRVVNSALAEALTAIVKGYRFDILQRILEHAIENREQKNHL